MTDAKLPAGFEERLAGVKGVRLRYLVGGAGGSSVVLVHGLGGAASNWAELAPLLARRHRVLVPDLPGHGGSSPLPAVSGLEPYADRVAALAEREEMAPFALVGHSLGAVVALRLALRRPELVSGIVLAGAAGITSAGTAARRFFAVVNVLKPARRISRHRSRVERSALLRRLVFEPLLVADPLGLSAESVEGFLDSTGLHTDTVSAWRALAADDPREELEAVRCPSLVLWGAADKQLPLDDAFEYARRLRAPLRVIADCGHLLIGERPHACADAIEALLES